MDRCDRLRNLVSWLGWGRPRSQSQRVCRGVESNLSAPALPMCRLLEQANSCGSGHLSRILFFYGEQEQDYVNIQSGGYVYECIETVVQERAWGLWEGDRTDRHVV